jgi:hypothetical protein
LLTRWAEKTCGRSSHRRLGDCHCRNVKRAHSGWPTFEMAVVVRRRSSAMMATLWWQGVRTRGLHRTMASRGEPGTGPLLLRCS